MECSIHCRRDDHDCGNIAAISIGTEIALVKLRGLTEEAGTSRYSRK